MLSDPLERKRRVCMSETRKGMLLVISGTSGTGKGTIIEALMKAGRVHEALRDIRAAWGKMLDRDSLTCWERLDVPEMNDTHYYDAPGSYCHGWGASPAWQLPEWIAGVRAVKDGYEEICVQPNLGDLDWAEANVPTPKGEIFARAEKKDGCVKIYLDIPESVKRCTVMGPGGREESVAGSGAYEFCFR